MNNYPDIYLFNPTTELALANGTVAYQAPSKLRKFEEELCILPRYFANDGDFVIVPEIFNKNTVNINYEGFPEVDYISKNELLYNAYSMNWFYPWGCNQVVHHQYKKIFPFFSECFQKSTLANYKPAFKETASRKTCFVVLDSFLEKYSGESFLSKEDKPIWCSNLDEIKECIVKWKKVVLKSPLSSSGRGILMLRENELNKTNIHWFASMQKTFGGVYAEKWLNKILDYSLHFKLSANNKVEFIGKSFFSTDEKGQYTCSYLNPKLEKLLSSQEMLFFEKNSKNHTLFLNEILSKTNIYQNYQGFIGVDAMLYRDVDGTLKTQPCIEINCRFTMGLLSLFLEKYMVPQSSGKMHIAYLGEDGFREYHQKKQEDKLIQENGLIKSGYLPLVPPIGSNGAWIEIE